MKLLPCGVLKSVMFWCGTLLLSGCAALLNSDRPKYSGPTIKPVWHNADVRVVDTPIVSGGVVYAVAKLWDSQRGRVSAFDARNGKKLWMAQSPAAHIIVVAGGTIFADDGSGRVSALDAASGSPAKCIVPRTLGPTTYADGVLYIAGKDGTLHAVDVCRRERWASRVPVSLTTAPVVGGQTVYVFGTLQVDELTPAFFGLYAFDRTTGALRWKRESRERFGKKRYDPKTSAMVWVEKPEEHLVSDVVADARTVYVWQENKGTEGYYTSETLSVLDAASGMVHWQHQHSGSCPIGPVLLDSHDVLVCDGPHGNSSENGWIDRTLLRSNGAKQWEAATSWEYEHFIPHDRFLIVSDHSVHELLNENGQTSPDSWLTLVDRRNGNEVWRTEIAQLAVFTLPAYGAGLFVVGSEPFKWGDPPVQGSRDVAGLWAWRSGIIAQKK